MLHRTSNSEDKIDNKTLKQTLNEKGSFLDNKSVH